MASQPFTAFTAGYLAGGDHRTDTAADAEAEGEWGPDDGYLLCPGEHPEPDPDCEWCEGWREAWT